MNRIDFAKVLVGISDYVEGATRLQKYGFLTRMKVKGIESLKFYDDWKASNYGPFSPSLASDIEQLVKKEIIKKYAIKNEYGFLVDRFTLMDEGKDVIKRFKQLHPKKYKEIEKIVTNYKNKSLSELLQDVYFQFPHYAVASKIRDRVNREIYETDSYLSPLYDYPDP